MKPSESCLLLLVLFLVGSLAAGAARVHPVRSRAVVRAFEFSSPRSGPSISVSFGAVVGTSPGYVWIVPTWKFRPHRMC